jgi:diguanylate cyclase (GGDEF)-like protein/PAS domain S-box-containing protein
MPLIGWFVVFAAVLLLLAMFTRPGRASGGRVRRMLRPFRALGSAIMWRSRLASDTQRMVDALPEAVVAVDAHGLILAANAAAAAILLPGRPSVESLFDEALLADLLADLRADLSADFRADRVTEQQQALEQWWESILDHGFETESLPQPTFVIPGARPEDLAIGLEVMQVTGTLAHRRIILRICTGPIRAGRVGVSSAEGFLGAFDSAPHPMAIIDLFDGSITEANAALGEMLGLHHESLLGRRVREFTHPQDAAVMSDLIARVELGAITQVDVEQRVRRADGDYRVTALKINRIGETQVAVHFSDLTEMRATARQLSYRERHDELTGLANRASVVEILTELLSVAEVSEISTDTVGVVHVDLDNFKQVNDSLGHALGDVVLQQIAARLQAVTVGSDVLGRLGADEFVILLDGAGQRVDARAAADRALRVIKEALVVQGAERVEMFLSASIGYVVANGSETAEELLAIAEVAMQSAKAAGRDTIVNARHSAGDQVGVLGSALRITSELRRGIQRGELVPFFQPILSLRSGRVTGYEVLARWEHPERGLLGPGEFMAQAEESGVMLELGAAMLRGALTQLREWRAESPAFDRRTVSVNVATRQLTDPGFYHLMADILEEVGIGGESLWLEITETSLLSDVKGVMAALTDLRALGIRLAVDDFGTGYSSLTYLKRFPVEAIKIDRSFVSGLGHNDDDSAIVDAVVRLGSALNLTVVAEGVETKEQARALQALGCDRGQGYLFGRPVAATAVSRI